MKFQFDIFVQNKVKPISFSASSNDIQSAVPSRIRSCRALTPPPSPTRPTIPPTTTKRYVPPTRPRLTTTPKPRPIYTTTQKPESCDYDTVSSKLMP